VLCEFSLSRTTKGLVNTGEAGTWAAWRNSVPASFLLLDPETASEPVGVGCAGREGWKSLCLVRALTGCPWGLVEWLAVTVSFSAK